MTDQRMERVVEVVNVLGFHARLAAEFVRLAGKFGCDLWLERRMESAELSTTVTRLILKVDLTMPSVK